jgi:signal transduction histidine kinase
MNKPSIAPQNIPKTKGQASFNKLAIALVLIVAIPILLLGWFTYHSAFEQKSRLHNNFMQMLSQQSNNQLQSIQIIMQQLEQDLQLTVQQASAKLQYSALSDSNYSAVLRNTVANHPLTLFAFLMKDGQLVFPDTTNPRVPLSKDEYSFAHRTAKLWTAKAQLQINTHTPETPSAQAPPNAPATNQSVPPSGTRRTSSLEHLTQAERSGWIPWYWQEGLHFIFWIKTDNDFILGVEVDRIALLSQLIGALPDGDSIPGTFVIQNERQYPLHQFGQYTIHSSDTALISFPLPAPLQSWSLNYYGPVQQWKQAFLQSNFITQILAFVFLCATLILGALWFWKESNRTIRQATQRVNFVSRVSHELKTPLTNIRLYAELLESKFTEHSPYLQVIQSESERLSRMIHNILTFSKKEQNTLQLHKQPVQLDQLVQEVKESFALIFSKRNMQFHTLGHTTQALHLDRDAACQIISNLISNAEKYAWQGEHVYVLLQETTTPNGTACTELYVADCGPGIPDNALSKIFKPFTRLDNSLNEGVSGTGIGLDIAQSLATAMHGEVMAIPQSKMKDIFINPIHNHLQTQSNIPSNAHIQTQTQTQTQSHHASHNQLQMGLPTGACFCWRIYHD